MVIGYKLKAGEGARTLDPDLGKVVLYQLSYSRTLKENFITAQPSLQVSVLANRWQN